MWFYFCYCSELRECFNGLNQNPDCRAVVLSAAGKHFTAGLDLQDALKMGQDLSEIDEVGRRGHFLAKKIDHCQVIISRSSARCNRRNINEFFV